ncbi:porin [Massilia glaciei]|uniref:Porin n=2 Tax=Massilia glaciei TaxID=1524097 RepID=A0A2U2I5W9_9BURK|nr:porin [Massilia glaciei]
MKKTLLATALLATACAAHAQAPLMVYGNIDLGLIKRDGAALNIGKRDHNRLGVKGTGELGAGIKALFQLEIGYEPDTGTRATGANEGRPGSGQRPLFQGQSWVGLKGGLGVVRIGRGLSAFQETSMAFEPWHGLPTPAGFQTDIMVAGFTSGPLGAPGSSADRLSDAVFYHSPEWNGLQLNATVAARESPPGGLAVPPLYPSGAQASANPFSLSTTYKNGPLAGMLAVERNGVESEVYSIGASIDITRMVPGLKLMASYIRQDHSHTAPPGFDSARAWVLGANWAMGAGTLLAGYGQKSPEGVARTRQLSLGYEYSLSRRTQLYFDASRRRAAAPAAAATRVNHFALGVNHAF